jgi:hypothetical protein
MSNGITPAVTSVTPHTKQAPLVDGDFDKRGEFRLKRLV